MKNNVNEKLKKGGNLLQLEGISASVDDIQILHDVNLAVSAGETHVIMGPNGAGKSTLGRVIMGSPEYSLDGGRIVFDGADITEPSTDKRARAGLFLSFQAPVEIPGVPVSSFLRSMMAARAEGEDGAAESGASDTEDADSEANTGNSDASTGKKRLGIKKPMKGKQFRKHVRELAAELDFDTSYLDRELGVGFSGGEKKKLEMLQLLLMEPKLAILDETDSGLDVDALSVVSSGIDTYKKRTQGALVIITHNTRILEHLDVDHVHVVVDGRIVAEGDSSLIADIDTNGFERFEGASHE